MGELVGSCVRSVGPLMNSVNHLHTAEWILLSSQGGYMTQRFFIHDWLQNLSFILYFLGDLFYEPDAMLSTSVQRVTLFLI